MSSGEAEIRHALLAAAAAVALDATGATLIRDGSHAMYVLPGGAVARIGRPGTVETAVREVWASKWLTSAGLMVTKTVAQLRQPIVVDSRPVTWWRLIPKHRAATPAELGAVLRNLHELAEPFPPELPTADPFRDLHDRVSGAAELSVDDRSWLVDHLADLRERYDELALGRPNHVIHGDAWQGNVAVPDSGQPVLLDLEHVAIGHPDWDLLPVAVDYTDFARLTDADYASFVDAYGGYDVTKTGGFRILADIQELRWVCFVASKAVDKANARREVAHRIECLRGNVDRPWSWTAF